MTTVKLFTGLSKEGTPMFRSEHPFFAKMQKKETRIPATFKAKSGRVLPCSIVVPDRGQPVKTFGAKEQARQTKWRAENATAS